MSAAPAAAANQASELTGPIRAAAWVGVADDLGKADREEALEGDHREAPEQLHADQRGEDPGCRAAGRCRHRSRPARPGRSSRRLRGRGPPASRSSARRSRPGSGHSARGRRSAAGRGSGSPGTDPARRGRPEVSAPMAIATLSTALAAPRPFSISASGSAARVASTYHASSGPLSSARKTPCRAVEAANSATESATVEKPERDEPDQAGQDQDRPAAERIGETAGRQLESEDDEPLEAEDEADLGERQAPRQREQHGHRDEQPGRQPAEPGQDEEPAARASARRGRS